MVTGGAGFIGSHLVEALSLTGHSVTVLDNLSSGHKKNVETFVSNRVKFVEGDIRDTALLDQLVKNCDGIFHLAALVSVPQSIEQPKDSFEINLQGTLNVLECCRKQPHVRLVFASSAAVYGDTKICPVKETIVGIPLSPYGLHKWMCEEQAGLYAALYSVNSVGLRFFNVFGPRQDPSSPYSGVISIFIDRLRRGQAPTIFGDGSQTRDFVYVGDVVQALIKAMNSKKQGFAAYNVGRGESVTINMLWKILCNVVGADLPAKFGPAREGEIHTSLANISKIEMELGYAAETNLKEGLKKTYEWATQ
ncbi:NAD-dependent epimerase/dehydratase family protein [Limnobacter alexandrii]|uniref:NAD-dependent epimerase/dehydratase family protein n=1 Tax=Limnobacter alexandrii TaxID=2570352 RepID=UPI001107AFD5|nr:NAD-dependent epimerase/dehydratase family protein [Limnobacter alexandrii]